MVNLTTLQLSSRQSNFGFNPNISLVCMDHEIAACCCCCTCETGNKFHTAKFGHNIDENAKSRKRYLIILTQACFPNSLITYCVHYHYKFHLTYKALERLHYRSDVTYVTRRHVNRHTDTSRGDVNKRMFLFTIGLLFTL